MVVPLDPISGAAPADPRGMDIDTFFEALRAATAQVPPHYFQLQIAGREEPIYRERPYSYELYRLLRNSLPENFPYVLDPELDKSGHPILAERVGGLKPDLVLHVPGSMEKNLLVLEVKPAVRGMEEFRKDLNTLFSFLEGGEYFTAVELLYGDCQADRITSFVDAFAAKFKDTQGKQAHLLWHRQPGHPAELIWSKEL